MLDLSKKLQLPSGSKIFVLNAPQNLDLKLSTSRSIAKNPVLIFVQNSNILKKDSIPAVEATKEDRLLWIAYPKAGRFGTDLNRDKLAKLMEAHGVQPVRIVSINDDWSALRFRPKKGKI